MNSVQSVQSAFQHVPQFHDIKGSENITDQRIRTFARKLLAQEADNSFMQKHIATIRTLKATVESLEIERAQRKEAGPAMDTIQKALAEMLEKLRNKPALSKTVESSASRANEKKAETSSAELSQAAKAEVNARAAEASEVTYESLPDEEDLGRFAATYKLGNSLVKEKFLEVFQTAEKLLLASKEAADERSYPVEIQEAEEKKDSTPAGIWVEKTESEALRKQEKDFLLTESLLEADLIALQKRELVTESFMKRLLSLMIVPKDLKVHQLADRIVQVYEMAHRHRLRLSDYLDTLMQIKAGMDNEKIKDLPLLFKGDVFAMRIALAQDGISLVYATKRLRNHPETVKTAVAQDGNALVYASGRLRNDPKTVKVAVAQDGNAIRFASRRLRKDPKIIRIAIAQNPQAAQYAIIISTGPHNAVQSSPGVMKSLLKTIKSLWERL